MAGVEKILQKGQDHPMVIDQPFQSWPNRVDHRCDDFGISASFGLALNIGGQ